MFARLQHNGFHHFRSKFTRLLSLIDVVHMTGDIYFEKYHAEIFSNFLLYHCAVTHIILIKFIEISNIIFSISMFTQILGYIQCSTHLRIYVTKYNDTTNVTMPKLYAA